MKVSAPVLIGIGMVAVYLLSRRTSSNVAPATPPPPSVNTPVVNTNNPVQVQLANPFQNLNL